jgi:SnoaL-like protein
MTRVIFSEDCGNSPKNIFLTKLTTAFAKGDSKFILGSVTDDIRWNIVGDKVIEGKDRFAEALKQMKGDTAVALTIDHVTTHGKAGAVNGTTKLKNGKTHAFCDVYEFNNAKGTGVKEITSYVIEIG